MRELRFHGSDDVAIHFSVRSRSRNGLWHDVWIERHGKWKGDIRCGCEDAVCRHKRSHVLDGGIGCWHIQAVEEAIAWGIAELDAA